MCLQAQIEEAEQHLTALKVCLEQTERKHEQAATAEEDKDNLHPRLEHATLAEEVWVLPITME